MPLGVSCDPPDHRPLSRLGSDTMSRSCGFSHTSSAFNGIVADYDFSRNADAPSREMWSRSDSNSAVDASQWDLGGCSDPLLDVPSSRILSFRNCFTFGIVNVDQARWTTRQFQLRRGRRHRREAYKHHRWSILCRRCGSITRCGLRACRVGEASNPGPPSTSTCMSIVVHNPTCPQHAWDMLDEVQDSVGIFSELNLLPEKRQGICGKYFKEGSRVYFGRPSPPRLHGNTGCLVKQLLVGTVARGVPSTSMLTTWPTHMLDTCRINDMLCQVSN